MAGEHTPTSIANLALKHIAVGRISSIDDDTSPAARVCKDVYEQCRDEMLRAEPWRFAVKRWIVAEEVAKPAFGYAHAFKKPTDMLGLNDPDPWDAYQVRDWAIEGDTIVTNDAGPLHVKGRERVTQEARFDPLFVKALSIDIAFWIAPTLRGDDFDRGFLMEMMTVTLIDARKVDATEQPPQNRIPGSWERARRGGRPNPWYRGRDLW